MNRDRFLIRVWDRVANKMYHPSAPLAYDFIEDKLELSLIGVDDERSSEINDAGELVYMQCAGFKDINGQLAFEGDILKHPYKSLVIILEWRDKEGQWSVGGYGDFEIIGNIHENPELLKTD